MEKEMQERAEDETVWFRPGKAGKIARFRGWLAWSLFGYFPGLFVILGLLDDSQTVLYGFVVTFIVGWPLMWQRSSKVFHQDAIFVRGNKVVVIDGWGRQETADANTLRFKDNRSLIHRDGSSFATLTNVLGEPLYDLNAMKPALRRLGLNVFDEIEYLGSTRGDRIFWGLLFLVYAVAYVYFTPPLWSGWA